MTVKPDEVIAVVSGDQLLCAECADLNAVEDSESLLTKVDEDELTFCDVCGKRIR